MTWNALRASFTAAPWLGSSPDPELAVQELRITPLDMPPDAMARLWSGFRVPYQLTQLYTVSPVPLAVRTSAISPGPLTARLP